MEHLYVHSVSFAKIAKACIPLEKVMLGSGEFVMDFFEAIKPAMSFVLRAFKAKYFS